MVDTHYDGENKERRRNDRKDRGALDALHILGHPRRDTNTDGDPGTCVFATTYRMSLQIGGESPVDVARLLLPKDIEGAVG
ncbi:hypothetical protein PILCRDRAFT_819590 [Piloderma croceum F 1598]|uniref:Uncharacterized protein n=1 Tax=Piloderma croceum (strain F 1598) TaxID=765440 RepID=A0A0C3BAM2_PILCF|nr:hypothetical protein PILCRDRAFT_819590 [Piloderma croceum F 1598]